MGRGKRKEIDGNYQCPIMLLRKLINLAQDTPDGLQRDGVNGEGGI